MLNGSVALIGCGAIGTPIAHKLQAAYKNNFALVASGGIKKKLLSDNMIVNNEVFSPIVISDGSEMAKKIRLLIICVKNYDLKSALDDIKSVVNEDTIILPLQNGISSFEFFSEQFPDNIILQGYVQGPNTTRDGNNISYTNPGVMHIGISGSEEKNDTLIQVYEHLRNAGVAVYIEEDIRRMVWKKWMLNVAGNSITALTGADYSNFKSNSELQDLCVDVMKEFLRIAHLENVMLFQSDIDDIIAYYVNYSGCKHTSMLEDILNERKTENDYLAGEICRLADKHNVELPMIKALYLLIKVKEGLYLKF